ncbi:hypothetical protein AHAS_Ahas16G0005200 [Arachis hypogaea]
MGKLNVKIYEGIKPSHVSKNADIKARAFRGKRSTFKSFYKGIDKMLEFGSTREGPKSRTRPQKRKPSSSRGTVHTLGRAVRTGMFSTLHPPVAEDQQYSKSNKSDTIAPAATSQPDTSSPTSTEDLIRDRPPVSGNPRNSFSARKDKNWKNSSDETYMQRFVCFRQGYRLEKWYTLPNRKREPKTETRTRCEAQFQVKFVGVTRRWHVTQFLNVHNHELLEGRLSRLLPGHRSMSKAEIALMNNMRKSRISTSQVYALLASQSSYFNKLNYGPRDMYNQIAKARCDIPEDVGRALNYLEEMAVKDKPLYRRASCDGWKVSKSLLVCDGLCREDYELFGDVVAFDATYNKNKYKCPFVVFTGVNHHNQTVVFAACIVTDETDETYIWVLQQFLEAMKGRAPSSVITDGARAIKNAIERLRKYSLDCMLGDYEMPVFCNKWQTLVEEFGVEEKEWLNEIYEKRRSWATCYIRGKFFARFRTISRCEGLHSLIKKYTKPHYDLSEFIENFQRMLGHMRFREFYAEYESARGVPVMQTCIEPLEMCAADTYTREVFLLFRPILVRLDAMKVLDYQTRDNSVIYYVCRYAKPTNVWVVECVDNGNVITCSCMRMESFGIPCEHIISVLVRRDVRKIPKCLVLHRWTKKAKESMSEPSSFTSELQASSRLCILNECARMMSEVACATTERFHETRDLMLDLYSSYKALDEGNMPSKPGLGGGTDPKGLVVGKSPNVAAIARNLVIIKLLVQSTMKMLSVHKQTRDLNCATRLLSKKFEKISEPKKAIVRELGFGGLMHIPPMNVPHKILKELANSFKLGKNTLETSYGSFKIRPKIIGDALGLNASEDLFPDKVSYKNLSEENQLIFRRFQGNTLKQLTDEMMSIEDFHPLYSDSVLAAKYNNQSITCAHSSNFSEGENNKGHNKLLSEKEKTNRRVPLCLDDNIHVSKNKEKKGEEKAVVSWVSNWNREQLVARIRAEIDGHMML